MTTCFWLMANDDCQWSLVLFNLAFNECYWINTRFLMSGTPSQIVNFLLPLKENVSTSLLASTSRNVKSCFLFFMLNQNYSNFPLLFMKFSGITYPIVSDKSFSIMKYLSVSEAIICLYMIVKGNAWPSWVLQNLNCTWFLRTSFIALPDYGIEHMKCQPWYIEVFRGGKDQQDVHVHRTVCKLIIKGNDYYAMEGSSKIMNLMNWSFL